MININTRNYSQSTNFLCGSGSKDIEILPFYVTSLNIPGITANLQEISGRQGATNHFAANSMSFNTLALEVLVDEDYKIFKDIFKTIKIDVKTGTFEPIYFDFWTAVTNDMGNTVLKMEYHDCSVASIGDITLNTNEDTTERTFSLEIAFDWYEIIDLSDEIEKIPKLRIE